MPQNATPPSARQRGLLHYIDRNRPPSEAAARRRAAASEKDFPTRARTAELGLGNENLRYIGRKVHKAGWSAAIFIFLYTLTPLSTTALFTATGIARVNPWRVLPPFVCGRVMTDGLMVYSGKYAAGNISGIFQEGLSTKSVVTLVAGLLVLGAFLFIDWRRLLEKHELRFNFKILKRAQGKK